MNRRIVYPGQIPLNSDNLVIQRNVQMALGHLATTVLGTSTIVAGLNVVPSTPAGLSVTVNAGTLITQGVADQNAFGSIGTNAAQTSIIYTTDTAQTFALATPGTAGQAINYLIQVQGQTVDGDLVVLPYYNAANPAVAYQGVNGTGQAQPTSRKDNINLALKAGTPAATGSQVTPGADSGFYPLAVVTVLYGATTVTAGNIATHPLAPYQTSLASLQASILAALQTGASTYCVDTSGTSNSIVGALSPAPAAYAAGLTFAIKVANPSTGACTLNLNGLGPKSLRNADNSNVSSGELVAGQVIQVVYDGSVFQIMGVSPTTTSQTINNISGALTVNYKTSAYTPQLTDRSAFLDLNGAFPLTLPAASTTASSVKFSFYAKNTGAYDVPLMVTGGDMLDSLLPGAINNQITQPTSVWNTSYAAITPAYTTGVDGTVSATRIQLQANPGAEVDTTLAAAVTTASTLSFYMKATSGTAVFRFATYVNATISTGSDQTIGSTWQRVTMSIPVGVTKISILVSSGTAASDLLLWNPRLEVGTASSVYTMYPGEERLFVCDGVSAWQTYVQTPFDRTYYSSGQFVFPPGYDRLFICGVGGGQGGSSGSDYLVNGPGYVPPGPGGSGGAYDERTIAKALYSPGATVSAIVGAGGLGPYNVAGAQTWTAGGSGGNSSLGTLLTIPGGTFNNPGASLTYNGAGGPQQGAAVFGGGGGGGGSDYSSYATSHPGGVSTYGGNGGNGGTNSNFGQDGSFPGGGGGGAANTWGNAGFQSAASGGAKGGNGAAGYIRVAGRLS